MYIVKQEKCISLSREIDIEIPCQSNLEHQSSKYDAKETKNSVLNADFVLKYATNVLRYYRIFRFTLLESFQGKRFGPVG